MFKMRQKNLDDEFGGKSSDYPDSALPPVYSTLGATASLIIIIVSYIVFLYAVTGKDISEAPLSTILLICRCRFLGIWSYTS